MFKQKLHLAKNIIQWLLIITSIIAIFLLVFITFNPIKSFQILRVMSGSMMPRVQVGSVVFVQKVDSNRLKLGDIITYTSVGDPDVPITHRLVAIEEKDGRTIYKAKGDANNTEDATGILASQIQGRVMFTLPYLGYISLWIKRPLGFGLLVIFPAILIIINELFNIKKSIEQEVERKSKTPIGPLLILCFVGFGLSLIKPSIAYYSDATTMSGMTFSAGYWDAPTQSVVINEVMWMGSSVSGGDDEWVELRNTSGTQVDLTGWTINLGSSGKNIILDGMIDANGFFLITERPINNSSISNGINSNQLYTTMTLPDSGRQLILKDSYGKIIDQTPMGTWPAGDHHGEDRQSMERDDIPSDGTLVDSWHTCTDAQCNDEIYWDKEGNDYGTPGHPNLSTGDSSNISLKFALLPGRKSVSFQISGDDLSLFDAADYQITYDSDQSMQGILGTKVIVGADTITENNIILGSCSSGGECAYNTGVSNLILKVVLRKTGAVTTLVKTSSIADMH